MTCGKDDGLGRGAHNVSWRRIGLARRPHLGQADGAAAARVSGRGENQRPVNGCGENVTLPGQ